MSELEVVLTEASIEEIDKAIGEIDWLCKYDITDRSSDIAITALKYVRKLKEMDEDEIFSFNPRRIEKLKLITNILESEIEKDKLIRDLWRVKKND